MNKLADKVGTIVKNDGRELSEKLGLESIVDMEASCKVHITYKMLRKNEVAETCIDLPISQSRYRQLKEGVSTQNKVWKEVREALVQLTILQGYEKLGAWGIVKV